MLNRFAGGLGKGYYLFIESSSPRRRGEKAVLLLKLEGRATCMRFWYHMRGSAIGSLKIIQHVTRRTENDYGQGMKASGKKRNQCDEWEQEWPKKAGTEVWRKENKNLGDRWVEGEVFLKVDRSVGLFAVHWVCFNRILLSS